MMVKYLLLFAAAVTATVFVPVLAMDTMVCEDCILQDYILYEDTKQPFDEMLLYVLPGEGLFS